MCSLFVIFFLGGWDFLGFNSELFFSLKIVLIVFLFVFVRANLPRYRFDQLMVLGWKIFLPISLGFIFFIPGFLISLNALKLKQLHGFDNFYSIMLV